MTPTSRHYNLMSSISLIGLIGLCIAWELWLAPLRPGGSMLVFKVLPLMIPLFGVLRGKRYTHQWTSMLALAYFTEGIVRATSDPGPSKWLALIETVLAVTLFAGCLGYARTTRTPPAVTPAG
jgi:uncharacterized membrane protein